MFFRTLDYSYKAEIQNRLAFTPMLTNTANNISGQSLERTPIGQPTCLGMHLDKWSYEETV
jgi:hypothetical protein